VPRPDGRQRPWWLEEGLDGWHGLCEGFGFFQARQAGPALSPDGRQLLVHSKGSIWPVELASAKPRGVNYPRPHQGKVALSQDGRLLVSGPNWEESYYLNRDSPLYLIDGATGAELRVVANFPSIRDFAVSPDGKLLAACGPEGLRLWDTATATLRAEFNGHRGVVTTVAFFPGGQRVGLRCVRRDDAGLGRRRLGKQARATE